MFAPFQCTSENIDFLRKKITKAELSGFTMKQPEHEKFYEDLLSRCTKADGTIDGSKLSALTFPFDREYYDIFISYSHDDEEDALYLYSWLTHCGINCFLDATIWNSADKILETIDKKYSRLDDGRTGYDYEKRNYSTSHVHTMLSMAMLEAINRSECCILLNTEQSVPLKQGIDQKTLSPWIYQESQFINYIKPQIPPRFQTLQRRTVLFCEGCEAKVYVNDSLKATYTLNLKNFKNLNSIDLIGFYGRGRTQLNVLYKKYEMMPTGILWD